MFFAHSLDNQSDKSQWQSLKDHLEATALLAAEYAREFGAENAVRVAGLLHDLGKYSLKFQARLLGSKELVDHSIAGAKEILQRPATPIDKLMFDLIAYAIAGHHAGLADYKDLQKRLKSESAPLDQSWKDEIEDNASSLWPMHIRPERETVGFSSAFLGRMIFSCLVDADYKDTERFYAKHEKSAINRDWPNLREHIHELISSFNNHMAGMKGKPGPINTLRNDILHHVRNNATNSPGLFTLTVPTGGGKTLASLGFALDHAKAHNLRRIIYAIPFTSIIDQNADIFKKVLGSEYILEHHASIDKDKYDWECRDKLRLAMEDWAAPIIVTTNVQLFESLFSNRPSRCRKLHNMAQSVIIIDEAQTLPFHLLRPCLAVLDELAKNYGTTIVLCTATQPAFDKRDFKHGGLDIKDRELAPDPAGLVKQLRRVNITKGHELDDDQLVNDLSKHKQALVIVNSRRHALSLYQKAKLAGLDGVIHLTTRQYAAHRRTILARVRETLKESAPCILIATSLVEAGVDLDFPRVWRAEAGLDQIAQAAGRCNRENKRSWEESIVTVFKPKDFSPPKEIKQLAADFAAMEDRFDDLLSPEAIKAYFSEVFWRKGAEQLDNKGILKNFSVSAGRLLCDYKTIAKDFKMISSSLCPIIINDNSSVQDILDRLNSEYASPGKAVQELQSYMVQVPLKDFECLIKNGRIGFYRKDLWEDQFAVLTDPSLYKAETGLIWEDAGVLENTIF
ncbi:MAG: CRISPR-associated helicase Cas3' [Alphaproteobacteria bacterium]|nr:CRISPR-associated helicase Cas3' [Alphaproteobacteria bacterium]